MLSGGDELGRTQHGNNNAYCHDSELSWTAWDGRAETRAFLQFVQRLVALRAAQPVLRRQTFLNGRRPGVSDVLWLRSEGGEMTDADWNDPSRRALGMLLDGDAMLDSDSHGRRITGDTLLVLFNTGDRDVNFTLPMRDGRAWVLEIDTAAAGESAPALRGRAAVTMIDRSVMVFRLTSQTPPQ
jgi:isoamylase